MVDSSEYGHRLYTSLYDAITAIETTVAETDKGSIYKMTVGPTYEDATTERLFVYSKNGTTEFCSPEDGKTYYYEDLITLP